MAETRRLAAEYRRATGQPLPVTAEIARYDAARLMDLELNQDPQQGGYDAVGKSGEWEGKRIQIKGRAIFDEKKGGQRIGQIKADKDWDSIMLVLMDDELEPYEIYELDRSELEAIQAEEETSSKRAKRGAMSVAKFKIVSHLVWTREEGVIDDEIWENCGGP